MLPRNSSPSSIWRGVSVIIWSCSRRWSIRSLVSTVTGSMYSRARTARAAADVEAVEEDLLPVHLVFLLLLLLLLLGVLLLFLLLLGLHQLEEGIVQQLLLQVLLQVHHGHVQQVHGLVEPRIDLQLLPELVSGIALFSCHRLQTCAETRGKGGAQVQLRHPVVVDELTHCAGSLTWPSNMMYARSTMSSVCSTLWSVMRTPMPRCLRPATMVWMS